MAATKAATKTLGRKKSEPLVNIGPDYVTTTPQDLIDQEAQHNAVQLEHASNLAVIDQTYGENLPYDKTRLENEARFFLQESAVAMLEAGRRLIVLKEHEEHGNFAESLGRIGIGERSARKMMQAAVKFSNRPTLAVLGKSKMLELMVEDDDDLDALADGGTLAGLKLDSIDKMSVRELKAALRKAKEEKETTSEVHEKLLESKNRQLDVMEKQFLERTARVEEWSGVVLEINANLMTMSGGVLMNISHLRTQIEETLREAEQFDLGNEEMASIAVPFRDHITAMHAELRELMAEFDSNLSGYLPIHTAPTE